MSRAWLYNRSVTKCHESSTVLDETHFHAIANATFMHLSDQLEPAYEAEQLDEVEWDEGAGILTIITAQGATFLLSKHGPSRQLWLSSPRSGGLHFEFCQNIQDWALPDGRTLKSLLADELKQQAAIQVVF